MQDVVNLSQIFANAAQVVQAIIVAVSLVFIWKQLKQQQGEIQQQTKLARASNATALLEMSGPFKLQIVQDKNLARFWEKGEQEFEGYDEIDKIRYQYLLIWYLLLHENIFHQYKQGLLDDDLYVTWNNDLKVFSYKHKLQRHWHEMRDAFLGEFSTHMDSLLFTR